ncbi:Dihydropteroate synthase [Fundidesulfovibrio magnetotacticus]|uniref:Dihydropteroate synthase n=1 Tax=Fundidesulfovibrio magnetotacticus TaxID=2730080 RepID=A0A6V8LTQ9_9BACT|nr:dihydropteroate synthase [Fundidesulfovibrio magnetotacticus]GFK95114.1 Dihydropteroate synthase [Fundidesulfovibrio magnetotacticus]
MSESRHHTGREAKASRPSSWTVLNGRVLGPSPHLVMGIVNATPDSFSDGGRFPGPEAAVDHALDMLDHGADVADVGGESTRPFAQPVDADEEERRVLPVVRGILARRPGAAVSVDTTKAHVAALALEAGAVIVNDVSACTADPGLLDVLAQHRPGYVLMHSQGDPRTMQVRPGYGSVLAEVARFFEVGLAMLVNAGLPEERIVLDPGIGFGKTLEHNLTLLRGLPLFAGFGRPLLMGLSNKSFLGGLLGLQVDGRGPATQVATALAWRNGAWAHRVHDAAGAAQALKLVEAMT